MRRRLEEAEEALALVQSLDPPGVGARSLEECIALQAKAADRYDPAMARLIDNLDLLAKGRMADLQPHLRRRRRGSCRHGRASCAAMIPSPAAASAARSREAIDARRLRPADSGRLDRSSSTMRRCRGCWSTAAIMPSSRPGPQDKAVEGLAERMPGQRQLAGEGARPARADDRQGRERDRQAAGGLLRAGRVGAQAADPGARSPRRSRCTNRPSAG